LLAPVAIPAVRLAPLDDHRPTEGNDGPVDPILLDDGRLTVLQDGCYITMRGTDIVLLQRRKEIGRVPVASVSTLLIHGHGMTLNAMVPLRLSETGAAVIVASSAAARVVVLSPATSGRAALRAEQARRSDETTVVRAGLAMLQAKVSNQASVLRYFARYRKRTEPLLHATLIEAASAWLWGRKPRNATLRFVLLGRWLSFPVRCQASRRAISASFSRFSVRSGLNWWTNTRSRSTSAPALIISTMSV
jgi:hypothetical protein